MTDTETPMRERIARIISSYFPESWGEHDEQVADAVLDAMREPIRDVVNELNDASRMGAIWTTESIWRAMIDAAKEGK